MKQRAIVITVFPETGVDEYIDINSVYGNRFRSEIRNILVRSEDIDSDIPISYFLNNAKDNYRKSIHIQNISFFKKEKIEEYLGSLDLIFVDAIKKNIEFLNDENIMYVAVIPNSVSEYEKYISEYTPDERVAEEIREYSPDNREILISELEGKSYNQFKNDLTGSFTRYVSMCGKALSVWDVKSAISEFNTLQEIMDFGSSVVNWLNVILAPLGFYMTSDGKDKFGDPLLRLRTMVPGKTYPVDNLKEEDYQIILEKSMQNRFNAETTQYENFHSTSHDVLNICEKFEKLSNDNPVKSLDTPSQSSASVFREYGFLGYINTILHLYGLAIVYSSDNDTNTTTLDASRVIFRGFTYVLTNNFVAKVEEVLCRNFPVLIDECKSRDGEEEK